MDENPYKAPQTIGATSHARLRPILAQVLVVVISMLFGGLIISIAWSTAEMTLDAQTEGKRASRILRSMLEGDALRLTIGGLILSIAPWIALAIGRTRRRRIINQQR
jgi:hypothetical protein